MFKKITLSSKFSFAEKFKMTKHINDMINLDHQYKLQSCSSTWYQRLFDPLTICKMDFFGLCNLMILEKFLLLKINFMFIHKVTWYNTFFHQFKDVDNMCFLHSTIIDIIWTSSTTKNSFFFISPFVIFGNRLTVLH